MKIEHTFRELCNRLRDDPQRTRADEQVIARFGLIFSPDHIPSLTKEEFHSFLLPRNNKHWWGIHRQAGMITKDMDRLRQALQILVDESQDIKTRLNELFPKGRSSFVPGLGRAIATPILAVVYPGEYVVYNSKVETALSRLGLYPDFHGESFALRYVRVNEIVKDLAARYNMPLLRLDEVFDHVATGEQVDVERTEELEEEGGGIEIGGERIESLMRFGLEEHLEDFLVANWEKTPLGKQYDLLEEDGDVVGQQYSMPGIGRADLVAREKKSGNWLVIELKRGRESDKVMGELARYMGWIRENKATEGEEVRGMIIAGELDERLRYALKVVPNTELYVYTVDFALQRAI